MTKIFISYRRADSQYVTDSIHEYLIRYFGSENVFLDVGSIPFGVDFREYLADQIATHDVVLVMIGPDWARIMQERADQQNDFVRIEIESALQQNKMVIPVLIKEAHMPDFSMLPESISELQWRNSATIRRKPDLESDCARLAENIKEYFKAQPHRSVLTPTKPPKNLGTRSSEILPAPFSWIEIPNKGYKIAKYPITNTQFVRFVESEGYNNRRWWTEAGWEARNRGWEYNGAQASLKVTNRPWSGPRRQWPANNRRPQMPIVGISWYEAVAFCLWLSEVAEEQIMLPTEDEWQYAAQGDDNRTFPWGNAWDCHWCNNAVDPCKNKGTTFVRRYEGVIDSPFGVVDMVGNVQEWCLTDFDSQTNNMNSDATERVCRGGAFYNTEIKDFRCDARSGYSPHYAFTIGFRIALYW